MADLDLAAPPSLSSIRSYAEACDVPSRYDLANFAGVCREILRAGDGYVSIIERATPDYVGEEAAATAAEAVSRLRPLLSAARESISDIGDDGVVPNASDCWGLAWSAQNFAGELLRKYERLAETAKSDAATWNSIWDAIRPVGELPLDLVNAGKRAVNSLGDVFGSLGWIATVVLLGLGVVAVIWAWRKAEHA
jgi:hypothetical protein